MKNTEYRPYSVKNNQLEGQETAAPAAPSPDTRFGFKTGGYNFLIPQDMHSEVLARPAIFPLFNSPTLFIGLTNVRGSFLPVYNLASILTLKTADPAPPSANGTLKNRKTVCSTDYTIILGENEEAVGIAVDEIPLSLSMNHAEPLVEVPGFPPPMAGSIQGGYKIKGDCWLHFNYKTLFHQLIESFSH